MGRRQTLTIMAATIALGLTGVATASANTATVQAPAGPHPLAPVAAPPHRAAAGSAGCGFVAAVPADRFKGIPTYTGTPAPRPYVARIVTNQGVISVRMLTAKAPCTTFSFKFLADRDFYDHTHCHRLTTQRIFVLQCGDPTGTGSGAPGYAFNDENLAGATYPAGTVAMANAGPNTNGSQFFFVTKDTKLRPNYTPFGTVISGLHVLAKIAAGGEDDQNGPGDGYPNLPVNIWRVETSRH